MWMNPFALEVRSWKTHLTSGTLLLSEILTRLPTLPLNDQSLQYLADFYVARLQDFPCINEVLKGLFALVKNHKLNNNSALCISICKAIFSEVHTQSLSQNSRKFVFDIVSLIVEKYTQGSRSSFFSSQFFKKWKLSGVILS